MGGVDVLKQTNEAINVRYVDASVKVLAVYGDSGWEASDFILYQHVDLSHGFRVST